MSNLERETPREIVDSTLKAIHMAGDLLLKGRRMSLEVLDEPPYVPSEFVFRELVCDVPHMLELTEEQQGRIITMVCILSAFMEERATIQQALAEKPEYARREVLNLIARIYPELQIDEVNPRKFKLGFGLFSIQVEAGGKTFMALKDLVAPNRGVASGLFSGWLVSRIGPMPLVRGFRKETKTTRLHEDVHAFQSLAGQMRFFSLEELAEPELVRAALNEEIRREDFDLCRQLLKRICKLTRHYIGIELQAYLWEKRTVGADNLNQYSESIELVHKAIFNTAFAPNSGLTEKEKFERVYLTILQSFKLEHHRRTLNAYVRQAVRDYDGEDNPWEWVASRIMILPPGMSPGLVRLVLLGRGKELERKPRLDTVKPLAQAMMIYVRRKTNPEDSGRGGVVTRKRIKPFLELLEATFNSREPFSAICQEFGIRGEDFSGLKKMIIKYARGSVPRGERGKVKRRLETTLFA